jgi:hypothetical protein
MSDSSKSPLPARRSNSMSQSETHAKNDNTRPSRGLMRGLTWKQNGKKEGFFSRSARQSSSLRNLDGTVRGPYIDFKQITPQKPYRRARSLDPDKCEVDAKSNHSDVSQLKQRPGLARNNSLGSRAQKNSFLSRICTAKKISDKIETKDTARKVYRRAVSDTCEQLMSHKEEEQDPGFPATNFETGKTDGSELPPGITDDEHKLPTKEGPKEVAGEGSPPSECPERAHH